MGEAGWRRAGGSNGGQRAFPLLPRWRERAMSYHDLAIRSRVEYSGPRSTARLCPQVCMDTREMGPSGKPHERA